MLNGPQCGKPFSDRPEFFANHFVGCSPLTADNLLKMLGGQTG